MADENTTPSDITVMGLQREIDLHYATRNDVHEMLEPVTEKLNDHLGWHKGVRYSTSLVIPLVCVLITAGTLLIVNFVP